MITVLSEEPRLINHLYKEGWEHLSQFQVLQTSGDPGFEPTNTACMHAANIKQQEGKVPAPQKLAPQLQIDGVGR